MHPDNLKMDESRFVSIDYTNYRGERKTYIILPHGITFGKTEQRPQEQWLMQATDVNRNVLRTFAVKDIHSWTA